MAKQIGTIAVECLIDLGITVVYAVIAGLLIVAIVASDDGPVSLMHAGLYAMLLPATVLLLIAGEVAWRVVGEWRAARGRRRLSAFAQPRY